MMWGAPHTMTHGAALIVLTPLSHGTYFIFILSIVSLSLFIFYFLSLFVFFFKRRRGGKCGREERRRRRRGSVKGPCDRIWGLIFYLFFSFYNLWGLVLSFVKIVAEALFNFFWALFFFYEDSWRCLI
jgi:amino acid transporter